MARKVKIADFTLGDKEPLVLIAGPCVIESEKIVMHISTKIKKIAEELNIPFIFKSSYTKDNRSSAYSYQGIGLKKGLAILQKVKDTLGVPVLSDVHYPQEVPYAAEVLDVIQLPAYLSMQTGLTLEIAKTQKVINIKKGQFLAPEDMKHIIEKIESVGNKKILLTERGSCFGYHNLVVDMRSLLKMRKLGYPVVFDVTHSLRKYGKPSSDREGGEPQFISPLARAGVAVGCDAIFIETHHDPLRALCDASSMLPLNELKGLLTELIEIDQIIRMKRNKKIGGVIQLDDKTNDYGR